MSLRPRHFVLIAVILGIFGYNLYHNRRASTTSDGAAPVVTTTHAVPAQTPAWTAFDAAASLRDAAPAQFDPALAALHQQLAVTHDGTVADLNGCLPWLEFYRQGALHPSRDPQWKVRSQRHLNGCVQFHLDTAASQ